MVLFHDSVTQKNNPFIHTIHCISAYGYLYYLPPQIFMFFCFNANRYQGCLQHFWHCSYYKGRTKMMAHFPFSLRCQTHWVNKSGMHILNENIKKSQRWRNTLSGGVVELAVKGNLVTLFPILVFSSTALRLFLWRWAWNKNATKASPKGENMSLCQKWRIATGQCMAP